MSGYVMTANKQLRSFVERIERLKEEIDDIQADIRELYNKEIVPAGFNKTAVGQVVALRRKRAKNEHSFDDLNDTVRLYFDMLAGKVDSHARAREAYDPETGEITEPSNRDASTGDEACQDGAPQGNRPPEGAPAGHEGRSREGPEKAVAADADRRVISGPVPLHPEDFQRNPKNGARMEAPVPDFLRRATA